MQAKLQQLSTSLRRSMSRLTSMNTRFQVPASESGAINMKAFQDTKAEMMRYDLAISSAGSQDGSFSDSERAFRDIIEACPIDSGVNFISCMDTYTKSDLYKVLRKMPKGGVLHTHGISTGNLRKMVEFIVKDDKIYRWTGEALDDGTVNGEFQFFLSQPEDKRWKHCATEYAEQGEKYLDDLYDSVHMPAGVPLRECWGKLNTYWDRTKNLSQCTSFWIGTDKFLWTVLEDLLESGVTYVEMKEVITFPYRDADDGLREVPLEEVMERFIKVIEAFKAKHPKFIGAKIVWLSVKFFSKEEIMTDLDRCIELKKKYPDYIAGYDLAGEEDASSPIAHYAEKLYIAKEKAEKAGVKLPFVMHAGESHDPNNTQLYDAVLVGVDRIGHGYAVPRFPSVMEHVRATKTVIECCPLSNMCLGYVQDLSNHPGWTMLNNGLVLTISHDDPGMFGYWDVTYDWTAVTNAWGLRIAQLRKIARDSLAHSTLDGEAKKVALEQFDADFAAWVQENFQK